jgi:hypothetical protein
MVTRWPVPGALAATVLGLLAACGGGSGGGNGGVGPTPPVTPPSSNPCSAVADEAPAVDGGRAGASDKRAGVYGDTTWSWLDHRWTRQEVVRRRSAPLDARVQTQDRDVGDIAVLEDNGLLVVAANTLDVGGRGLRFRPLASGGYEVVSADAAFRQALGARVTLSDDDSSAATVPFEFPFYGTARTAAFVNSDGNVTFGQPDSASTARNITRVLTGPARVALFFADLDPSTGGSVWLNASASEFTVTWCGVKGFDSANTTTAQATLFPDGSVEMRFASALTLTDAIIGLSPGSTTTFTAADLTAGGQGSPGAAVAERFSANADLDLEAASRRFYAGHGDTFDQLIYFTDQRVVTDAFAFESTVANQIRGLGVASFDESRSYGSGGRLSSVVVMDRLAKYPDDPRQVFLGENNSVSVLGQEVGHRWLTFFRFLDVNRQVSDALLGRDLAHWSFFADSDGSVMEGNDIEDLGGGAFRTVAAVNKYSRADLYAMGLAAENEVPPFFYVESPTNTVPNIADASAAPRVGVTFNGTRRDVRLQDVIEVMGRRQPSSAETVRVWRQAFVYVVGGGRPADAAQVAKLNGIRAAWEAFYSQAVEGRGRVDTRLQ